MADTPQPGQKKREGKGREWRGAINIFWHGRTWSGHLCIIIVTLRSFRLSFALLPLFFLLRRRTRARVYASATSLARLYSTTNVSAFVRLELLHCLPVGKYYSNRQSRGVTIMFSFTTNPSRPHRFYRWRGFRKREERTLEERIQKKFAADDLIATG